MNGFQQFQNPITTNPYLPTNQFQNRYSNPYMPTTTSQATNNGITWVQGIEGAKAYQLTPNSIAMLMDSESDGRFYIKVSDNVGMCTLRIFDYTEVTNNISNNTNTNNNLDLSNYVTKDELNDIISKIKDNGGNNNGKQSISGNAVNAKSGNKPLITE